MKSFRKYILLGTILSGLLAAGCGGSSGPLEGPPLGEGNIPIGRAQNKEMGESAVTVEMADGRLYYTFTKQQVIYAPTLPKGRTTVVVTPANRRFNKYTLEYTVGPDQFWAFNVRPLNRVATQVVKDIDVNVGNGTSFKVGDTFALDVRVLGANLDGVKPSVYVNGGNARIDHRDVMTFTKAGPGELIIELIGFKRVVDFMVEP